MFRALLAAHTELSSSQPDLTSLSCTCAHPVGPGRVGAPGRAEHLRAHLAFLPKPLCAHPSDQAAAHTQAQSGQETTGDPDSGAESPRRVDRVSSNTTRLLRLLLAQQGQREGPFDAVFMPREKYKRGSCLCHHQAYSCLAKSMVLLAEQRLLSPKASHEWLEIFV